MDKSLFPKVTALAAAFIMLQGAVSCVREELAVSEENIDMTVNVFSEGMVLPLGSIDTLTIGGLLASVDEVQNSEWLDILEGGAYAISYKGSYDLSESLNEMLSDLNEKIEPVQQEEKINLNLKDVDVSDMKVEAQSFPKDGPYEVKISDFVSAPDMPEIPSIAPDKPISVASEIYKYAPDMSDLNSTFAGAFKSIHKETDLITVPTIPSEVDLWYKPDEPIAVNEDLIRRLNININSDFKLSEDFELKLTLPKGVTYVDDILLHESAGLKVTVALENTFLQKGTITPEIDIDLHHLLHLDTEDHDDIAHLAKDFVLTENDILTIDGVETPFAKTKTYKVTGLVMDKTDWESTAEGYVLESSRTVTAEGSLKLDDLETTINYMRAHGTTVLNVSLEFVEFEVADVEMGVEPVNVTHEEKIPVELTRTQIPEQIESIDWVGFDDNSVITLSMNPSNIGKLPNLEIDLEEMNITFPQGMEVAELNGTVWSDVTDGKIEVRNEDLRDGFEKKIKVKKFNLPALDADNYLSLTDYLTVDAKVTAGGAVNSAGVPTSAADDIKFDITVDGDLTIDDYQATIAGYDHEIEPIDEEIKIELSEDVKDLGSVTVYPEGEPVIFICITIPQTGLNLHPMNGKGISIVLPSMIKFKEVDRLESEYGYSEKDGVTSLHFSDTDAIPSEILLPVDRLVVTKDDIVKNETDGKYYVTNVFSFDGGVSLSGGVVTKNYVETLTSDDSKVSIVATIPELVPSTVGIDTYSTTIEDKEIVIDIPLGESLPEELVSVGRIELKDVEMNFSINMASLVPYIVDAMIDVNVTADIPDMMILDPERLDKDGNLVISESVSKDELIEKDGIISITPIAIQAIDLTGKDLSAGISDKIVVSGGVSISQATITDELLGKEHEVIIEAGIPNIAFDKVNAKVAYEIEPMKEEIDLSSLTEILKGEEIEAVLDLNRFHIALDLTTNLSVPLVANIELVPYFDGVAGTPVSPEEPIVISTATSVDEVSTTRIWIANDDKHKPENCSLFVPLDLLSLVKQLPDKIEFSFTGGTDSSKDAVLGLGDQLTLKTDYEVALPIELGEDFEISYRTVIDGLGDVVAQIFSYADLALTGEFVNGLPLELDICFNLLDSEGNVVAMDETAGKQVLPACSLDGTASKCDLNIALVKKEGSEVTDISAIEVIVTASSGDAAGVPLTQDVFVTGTIKAALPNGLTVDLGELMKK